MQGFVANYTASKNRCKILSQKSISRGSSANKLTWQSKQLSFHYNGLLNKSQKNYQEILKEIFN